MFLQTQRITKEFGKLRAVNEVSLEISKGDVHAIIGPNGAGKTTTIRILATVLPPDRGDATIGGCSVRSQADSVRRLIGVCPQELALYPFVHARVSLKGCTEQEFTRLTGAAAEGFQLQLGALKKSSGAAWVVA
jgi:ABC-2 type transport system ATP-binding protein